MRRIEYDPDDPLATRLSDYLLNRLQSRADEVDWYLATKKLDWDQVTSDARRFAKVFGRGALRLGWFDSLDRIVAKAPKAPEASPAAGEVGAACEIEAISQVLADKVIRMLKKAEERVWKLARQVLARRKVSVRGQRFLRRVAECYLLGFDTESIIMCRSVLEMEFKVHVPDALCKQQNEFVTDRKGRSQYFLQNRVNAAEQAGHIGKATADDARRIVREGNEAVHDSAKARTDSLSVILATLKVIDALAGSSVRHK